MSAKRVWILVASVMILVGLTVVTVFANPFSQTSSEDGAHYEEWIGTADTVIGDDPDEDGYTGPVVSSPGVAVPSEGESDLETLPAEPASEGEFRPDELQPEAPEAEPQWSGFYYDFSAGATMRPRASLTNWEYWGGGCLYTTKGYDLLTLPLNLPEGVRIDYLRLYYYDSSTAGNLVAYITIYDGGGGIADLISVVSSGSAGYGYVVSDYVGQVVDNSTYAYVLNVGTGVNNETNRLCGLRVAYRLP
ncbi:MAG TPA: hypothetical protein PKW57_03700 [Anaerolineaceae bacterium]|nr:hypothetical protein [Anaerolineaceae bacterium]